MKKKIIQQLFAFAAAALTCITIQTGTPGITNPNPPAPGNVGNEPGIENPEKGGEEEPGINPQHDAEPDLKKHE